MIKSLIINPGSTSTKVGIFEDETLVKEETLRHSTEEIESYASIIDQKVSSEIPAFANSPPYILTRALAMLRVVAT